MVHLPRVVDVHIEPRAASQNVIVQTAFEGVIPGPSIQEVIALSAENGVTPMCRRSGAHRCCP